MGLNQKYGIQHHLPPLRYLGLEIWQSDGVPTESGPATGALAIDTTNGVLYINTGTPASATWNPVGAITAGEITLARGSILRGSATGVAEALDAKTSAQILIGDGTDLVSVAVSGDATISSTGVVTIANNAVAPANLATYEALTATADGLTTGLMSGNTSHAVVTSASATNACTLPASSSVLIGKQFTMWVGANGFELLTPASSNATINAVDSDGTNQVDVPATTLLRCTLVDTSTWIVEAVDELGAVITALIPDND